MIETDQQSRARPPDAVYDLAMRLRVKPDSKRSGVRLTQTGRMKRSLDVEAWMPFTASQTISTHICQFDRRAKAGPFGLISARDALERGEGRFDIRALGFITVARAEHTPALVRGELMRYLAELAWAPDAILLNAALRWRVDGPDMLAVSAGDGETASETYSHSTATGGSPAPLHRTVRVRPPRQRYRHRGEASSQTIAFTTNTGCHLPVKSVGKLMERNSLTGRPRSINGKRSTEKLIQRNYDQRPHRCPSPPQQEKRHLNRQRHQQPIGCLERCH